MKRQDFGAGSGRLRRFEPQGWGRIRSSSPPSASKGRPPVPDAMSSPVQDADKAELDQLMTVFLDAFTNVGGVALNVQAIRDVFIPEGMIISAVGNGLAIYDLESFIEPREKLLTDGTLTDFREWEVAETTEIFQSVAHRFSTYRKAGMRDGARFEGEGRKTTQFVRTADGWRMSSMAWDDVSC